MKITPAHLAFWRAKKAPPPSWALNVNDALPSIHRLINSQVERCRTVEPDDTLALLSLARKRGHLLVMLHTLRDSSTNQLRRNYAEKWLKRIEENQP